LIDFYLNALSSNLQTWWSFNKIFKMPSVEIDTIVEHQLLYEVKEYEANQQGL
jgi:hypothetical protein